MLTPAEPGRARGSHPPATRPFQRKNSTSHSGALGESMRISRKDTVAGHPIKQVRDFLRRLDVVEWDKVAIAEFFGVAPALADAIIKEMLAANMIERCPQCNGNRGRAFYRCGDKGRRLRNAILLKPISRAEGETLLTAFLLRVAEVNANEDLLYAVREV